VNRHFKILRSENDRADELPAQALVALINGYEDIIGMETYSRWVVKNPSYELYWRQVFNDFPNARVIFMVRDPRDVILSGTIKRKKKRYVKGGGDPARWKPEPQKLKPPMLFHEMWENSISEFHNMKRKFPKQILLVRFEDLVSGTRDAMQAVCNFLEIDWSDNLLAPSFLGYFWKGNSMQQKKFSGVGASKTRKKYSLAPRHLWQIEAWLGDTMTREPGRYAPSGILEKLDVRAFTSPLPEESIFDFLRNRRRMWSNWRRQA
jgi:hypothetical protein